MMNQLNPLKVGVGGGGGSQLESKMCYKEFILNHICAARRWVFILGLHQIIL